jgi:iron complex transport system substrate-binding protein
MIHKVAKYLQNLITGKQAYRLIKSFLLMVCSSLLIAACHQSVVQEPISQEKPSECRVIQHKSGEACVPVDPQRVTVLGGSWTLDPVLSLGVKPIAASIFRYGGREYIPGLSDSDLAGIEIIGLDGQPSVERILMLKPDLVISLDLEPQVYKSISAIAPTVVREFETVRLSFKENLRSLAQILNREEEAERALAQYEEKAGSLRQLLESQSYRPEVSVLIYVDGNFSIPASDAPFFQALNDLGVRLKPVFLDQSEYIPLSIEVINEYDTDVLFIVDFANKPSSFFLQNPMISTLRSARNNRAYVVGADTWWAYGPLGMNKLLDEVPKYLLKAA